MPSGVLRAARAWGGVLCALLFLLLGCAFYGYAGLEVDEAMFAAPFYREWCFYAVHFGHHRLPVMHMSYLGALKTWLYAPILSFFKPTPASLRVPAILLGCAAVLLVWRLLDRVHGRRAALAGAILLATDTAFLLTTTFDWGPVALEHLLLAAAMLLAVLWFQRSSALALGGAAFCCGLGLWDKAEFVWVLCGICAGSLVFIRRVSRKLTWRLLALALSALLLGALPLLIYNLSAEQKFVTFRSNGRWTTTGFKFTLGVLRATWNGSALFAFLVHTDAAPGQPRPPRTLLEKSSFAVHSLSGDRGKNFFEPLLWIALAMLPFLWRTPARDPLRFCLLATAAGWMAMTVTGGGWFSHHTVLLWPLPQMFVAIAFAQASLHLGRFGKPALAAAIVVAACANLLVTNQYLYWLVRNGPNGRWTDAIYSLADGLRTASASQVMQPDWGMLDSLEVLDQGRPDERLVADPPAGIELFADPQAIWVLHTLGNEISAGINGRVFEAARRAGFEPLPLRAYDDGNGRPIFQTFRFVHH